MSRSCVDETQVMFQGCGGVHVSGQLQQGARQPKTLMAAVFVCARASSLAFGEASPPSVHQGRVARTGHSVCVDWVCVFWVCAAVVCYELARVRERVCGRRCVKAVCLQGTGCVHYRQQQVARSCGCLHAFTPHHSMRLLRRRCFALHPQSLGVLPSPAVAVHGSFD